MSEPDADSFEKALESFGGREVFTETIRNVFKADIWEKHYGVRPELNDPCLSTVNIVGTMNGKGLGFVSTDSEEKYRLAVRTVKAYIDRIRAEGMYKGSHVLHIGTSVIEAMDEILKGLP